MEPPVVRVLDVPSAATLPEVHDLLQAAMGWTDSHLHQFEAGQARYGIPDPDFAADDPDLRDERSATLRDLPETFGYLYDFGDSWHHDIDNLGPGGPEPGCVDGQGACPPEDCGGWPGYEDFRDAIAEPTHPEHEHLTSWAGPWTDAFDREGTDALVRATVGQVPGSVRLLLGLLDGGVRLTPGGRLPRVVVRAVQAERPTWSMLDRPASIEEDLPPLAALHDLLRGAGLLRLAHGVLTPTKAAADDLQTIRRLRQVLEPDSFHDILIGVITALLATRRPGHQRRPRRSSPALAGPVGHRRPPRQHRRPPPPAAVYGPPHAGPRPRRPRHRHALGHLAPRALGHHPPAPRHRPGPLPPPVGRHRHLTATGRDGAACPRAGPAQQRPLWAPHFAQIDAVDMFAFRSTSDA